MQKKLDKATDYYKKAKKIKVRFYGTKGHSEIASL